MAQSRRPVVRWDGSPLPQRPSASIHQSLTKVTIFPPPPLFPSPISCRSRKDKSTRQLPHPLYFSFQARHFPPSEIPEIPIFFVSFFSQFRLDALPFPTQPDVSPSVPHLAPIASPAASIHHGCCSCTPPRQLPPPPHDPTTTTTPDGSTLFTLVQVEHAGHSVFDSDSEPTTRRTEQPTLLRCPPPSTQAARSRKPP